MRIKVSCAVTVGIFCFKILETARALAAQLEIFGGNVSNIQQDCTGFSLCSMAELPGLWSVDYTLNKFQWIFSFLYNFGRPPTKSVRCTEKFGSITLPQEVCEKSEVYVTLHYCDKTN